MVYVMNSNCAAMGISIVVVTSKDKKKVNVELCAAIRLLSNILVLVELIVIASDFLCYVEEVAHLKFRVSSLAEGSVAFCLASMQSPPSSHESSGP